LAFLQSQPFVIPDKIALIGWSQGGGVVLETIPTRSLGRPNPSPTHDFVAAIVFYPGLCSDKLQATCERRLAASNVCLIKRRIRAPAS
jgi:dienelactone hydrolase